LLAGKNEAQKFDRWDEQEVDVFKTGGIPCLQIKHIYWVLVAKNVKPFPKAHWKKKWFITTCSQHISVFKQMGPEKIGMSLKHKEVMTDGPTAFVVLSMATINSVTLNIDPGEHHFLVGVGETEYCWDKHRNDDLRGHWTKTEVNYPLASTVGDPEGFCCTMSYKLFHTSVGTWKNFGYVELHWIVYC